MPTEDAQAIKFQSGETQILERAGADNFSLLQKDAKSKGQCLYDLGPGLEFNFLLLNMNNLDPQSSAILRQNKHGSAIYDFAEQYRWQWIAPAWRGLCITGARLQFGEM